MFIILHGKHSNNEYRINVNSIACYGYKNSTKTVHVEVVPMGSLPVTETPEEIDMLIEEAKEAEIQNIDNILGISYGNYSKK